MAIAVKKTYLFNRIPRLIRCHIGGAGGVGWRTCGGRYGSCLSMVTRYDVADEWCQLAYEVYRTLDRSGQPFYRVGWRQLPTYLAFLTNQQLVVRIYNNIPILPGGHSVAGLPNLRP